MAINKTINTAQCIHGMDPQNLIEKVIRERIYQSSFWNQDCDTLEFEDTRKIIQSLNYVGGIYSNTKPTPFLCCILKLLQIQPSNDKLVHLLTVIENKYEIITYLFYLRLAMDNVKSIENLLKKYLDDFRKIRIRKIDGRFEITTIDQLIDNFLNDDRVFNIVLPRLF